MTHPIQPVRRKIERSSRPEYQKLIDGDSIYTCSKYTSERETQLGDPLFRSSKKFKRSIVAEDGPWFFDIEPVLDRRDQDRRRLWKRQKNKRLKRSASATRPQDPQQADNDEADTTITSAGPIAQGAPSPPLDTIPQPSSRAVTPDLPPSDLLRSIHHEAMSFYSSHNVISIPPAHRGPRPKNWEEPIAMTRALDGSALVAIGVLLEEITKDQIESGHFDVPPVGNANRLP
ncbi:hypothetical protein PGTUg99_032465 [Puccinia graminis f. sp. tritici]|uniref:Uncharacterized protein n=1 Tax=Puccinia graminis f. sp. tritici TaxID=56615 RepID=A0A5B0QUJ9_PUCGR|nr:hypothetical protein PGTUg99_032465 [Puccinia graminis f. sp. tritici]